MSLPADPHASDGLLVDLAADLLAGESREELLVHLRACVDCEGRFREICGGAVRLPLRPRPALVGGSIVLRDPPRSRARLRHAVRPAAWIVAAAAALALIVLLPRWTQGPRDDGLDYWLPIDASDVRQRQAIPGQNQTRWQDAVQAYARRETSRVIALLGDAQIPKMHEDLELILASALLHERRPAEALAVLDRLDVETLPPPYRSQALWIRYAALRREGRDALAVDVARELARGKGELAERARAELASR